MLVYLLYKNWISLVTIVVLPCLCSICLSAYWKGLLYPPLQQTDRPVYFAYVHGASNNPVAVVTWGAAESRSPFPAITSTTAHKLLVTTNRRATHRPVSPTTACIQLVRPRYICGWSL